MGTIGLPYLLARIAARTGAGLWRQRMGLLVGGMAVGALSLYQMTYAGPSLIGGLTGASGEGSDCADAAMAAVTRVDDAAARAAYACLETNMRNTTEDAFVAGMHDRAMADGQVSRVGDQKTQDGGRIVFYTVEQQGKAVGYIVYLDPAGKVIRVE
jgi:hypothetical protein